MWRKLLASGFTCVLLLGLTGCDGSGGTSLPSLIGGGGPIDNSGEFSGAAQSAAAYRDTLTSDEAYHLLRRAAFGATPEQVDAAVRDGLSKTVDNLLREKPIPAQLDQLAETYEDNIARRWMPYILESPNPLHEKLALFWHDRFATSRRVLDGRDRNLSVLHWKMLRRNALGNYRAFLQELTIDPLMLIWLDGANSPKSNPNENYTREFWELFTLGRDVLYTEADIQEGARAFTGITLFRERDVDARPIYDILNHDETTKTIFPGRTPAANFDYLRVIDLTLAQPEAAAYVARNLFVYFVHDEPSDALVTELARGFRESDFEIEPLVRRILKSQAMFSHTAQKGYVTSPVEHIACIARTLDIHAFSEESQTGVMNRLVDDLRGSGQELLNPPGVQGWTENKAWLEDQWILDRVRAIGHLMEMEFGPQHREDLPYDLLPDESTWDQRESRGKLVDAAAAAFHVQLTEEERDIYVEVLDQNGWRALHLEEPDRRPRHVFEMIRLLTMHDRVIGR